MPKNKNKNLPILFSHPKRGIAIIQEKYVEIGLNPNEQEQDQYTKDYLLDLEEEIKSLSHAKEQIAHLKAFRDLLSGYCIHKGKIITILQCSGYCKLKQCRFKECKTSENWKSLFL